MQGGCCVCVPVVVEIHNLKNGFSQLHLSTQKLSPVAGFIVSATLTVALSL